MGVLSISSDIQASPEVVWEHATTPAGINREFAPLLRMTFPADIDNIVESWEPGRRLFRSWILLGGFLPLEYDDLVIVEIEPGVRFLERSSMLTQRVWEHERTIEALDHGCRIADRVEFTPRIPMLEPLFGAIFRATFWWRHRNLRRIFASNLHH